MRATEQYFLQETPKLQKSTTKSSLPTQKNRFQIRCYECVVRLGISVLSTIDWGLVVIRKETMLLAVRGITQVQDVEMDGVTGVPEGHILVWK